jgi:putative DNA methylase
MAKDRPDLKPLVGQKLTVIAWLWARTVKSPNPAFAQVHVPLTTTFVLSTKPGKEAYVEPVIEDGNYRFTVKVGRQKDPEATRSGTKLSRGGNFRCIVSGTPITPQHIRSEGTSGRIGACLMAVVVEGNRGRSYLSPSREMEKAARRATPEWKPEGSIVEDARAFTPTIYGMRDWSDLFTSRQLVALTVFSDLVTEARERVQHDAPVAGLPNDRKPLRDGGIGATAYAEAVSVYLACVVDRMAYYGSSLATWLPKDNALRDCMPRQALAMTWDFAECNPLGKSSGDVISASKAIANYLDVATPVARGKATQSDVQTGLGHDHQLLISTDPPYFDNISYADLSDYF